MKVSWNDNTHRALKLFQKVTGMTRYRQLLQAILCPLVALFMGATAYSAWACVLPIQFSQADVFFEENTSDEDLGFHFDLDGEGWKRVIIFDSNWRVLVNTSIQGGCKRSV